MPPLHEVRQHRPAIFHPDNCTVSGRNPNRNHLRSLDDLSNIEIKIRKKDIEDTFLNEETKTITELTKINTERQELVKKLTKEKESHS